MNTLFSTLCAAGLLAIMASGPAMAEDETRPAATGGSANESGGGDAMQGGGAGAGGDDAAKASLQKALQECEKLSGSASAKCQERALSEHPGEW